MLISDDLFMKIATDFVDNLKNIPLEESSKQTVQNFIYRKSLLLYIWLQTCGHILIQHYPV